MTDWKEMTCGDCGYIKNAPIVNDHGMVVPRWLCRKHGHDCSLIDHACPDCIPHTEELARKDSR